MTDQTCPMHSVAAIAAQFDHRDHESAYDPVPRWAKLRSGAPLEHSEKYGGFEVASRYDTVCDIARNAEVFSSHLNQTTIPTMVTPPFPPINFDPPEHGFYRAILNPFFTPGKMKACEPWIGEMVNAIVDRAVARDIFDLTTEVALPLTRDVVLRIMGIKDAPVEVNQWADDLIFLNNEVQAAQNIAAFLGAEVAKRRANPGDDVLSGLVKAQLRERQLNEGETTLMAMLLLLGGLDTTKSATSSAVWYLVQNPKARQQLAEADDRKWELALDEFIRWSSPAPAHARTAKVNTEVQGCPVPAGQRVMMLFGSANRDEKQFPNPDEVVLDRFPNRHLGFGMGPHRCLGSHLAKLMMGLMLKRLLPELEHFELADPDAVVWEAASVRGIQRLSLRRKVFAGQQAVELHRDLP